MRRHLKLLTNETRKCIQCEETKNLKLFERYSRRCRKCVSQRRQAWDDARKEKERGYKRKWRNANKAAADLTVTRWQMANPDRVRAAGSRYNAKNRDIIHAKNNAHYAELRARFPNFSSSCVRNQHKRCGGGYFTSNKRDHYECQCNCHKTKGVSK